MTTAPRWSRRTFLAMGATVVVGACSGGDDAGTTTRATDPSSSAGPAPTGAGSTSTASPASTAPPTVASTAAPPPTTVSLTTDPFGLGVASGDPDADSAVLWTRLTGADLPDAVDVVYEVSTDETFTSPLTGTATVTAADGHALHLTISLTAPSWYRFHAGGFTSPVGRVAPTPARRTATEQLRIASASCQNLETGFYAAYRDLVAWAPDVVVFLGDFIYEWAGSPLGDPSTDRRVRAHVGPEPTDLASYRDRYAQYLADADLRAARAACPWLVVWDDHEVENDYAAIAPDHPADAPGFAERRFAAYRAWWEHMPVRLPPPTGPEAAFEIHRSARFGDLVDLVLLDGRQYRSDQACGSPDLSLEPACPEAADPARSMLGADQEAWLAERFDAASATWTVLGQQTVLTDLRVGAAVLNYDQWDGYAPARDRLLEQAGTVERLVVLTGDIHLAGVGVLPGVGVEFVTTSISSNGVVPADAAPLLASFDDIVDVDLDHRGYTRHTVTADTWTAEYRIVDDARDPASPVSTWRTFTVNATDRDIVIST